MINRLLLPALFVPAIACGGGESKTPTPLDTQTMPPDSPAVLECPPTGLMGSVGTAQAPVGAPPNACGQDGNTGCDWYSAPMMGSNTGITEFIFVTGIQDTMDQLQFRVATPIVLNTPTNWETNGASTAQYAALSIYLQSQNGSNVDRVLFPTNGSITVSESNQAMGGKTTAVVSATSYAELDDDGAVLAGGCVTDITGLNLFLVQGSATFQKPNTPDDGSGRPWMKIIPNDGSFKFGQLVARP